MATLDGKEIRQKVSKICIRYRFFRFRRKTNLKTKKSKKELKVMETNVKKVFLLEDENFDSSYIFSPSAIKKRVIGGKTYQIQRYFNGDREFDNSMKKIAANNYYKNRS